MKHAKNIAAVLLVCLTAGGFAQDSADPRGKPATASDAAPNKPSGTKRARHKVIAYYFHRTVRCDTCCAIETLAAATVRAEFADALKTGVLEWCVINMEAAGNDPFVKDYDLTVPALVLVDLVNGQRVRWTKLSRVWELVHNPPALAQYVRDELGNYLGGSR